MDPQETLSEKNRKFFNTGGQSIFEEQWVKDLQKQIYEHLQANLPWIGIERKKSTEAAPVKMLDYACGNGVLSRALFPYMSKCVGIDVSEVMVEKYNEAAREQGLSEAQMHAIPGDLLAKDATANDSDLNKDEMFDFDLVVISMALHHLENPQEGLKRLVERLKVGGVLVVIDRKTASEKDRQQQEKNPDSAHGQSVHNHNNDYGHGKPLHTVSYDSFGREEIIGMLENAGCSEADFVLHPKPAVIPMLPNEHIWTFYARGRKVAD